MGPASERIADAEDRSSERIAALPRVERAGERAIAKGVANGERPARQEGRKERRNQANGAHRAGNERASSYESGRTPKRADRHLRERAGAYGSG